MDKTLQKLLKIIVSLCIIYLIYLLFPEIKISFNWIIKILTPFIIGFIGAYLLLPIVNFLTKKKISYKVSVLIVVTIFVVLIVTTGYIVIPKTIEQITMLINNIPLYISDMTMILNKISTKLNFLPNELKPTPSNIYSLLMNIINIATNKLNVLIDNAGSYFLTIVVSPILIVYFLLEFKKITHFVKRKLLENDKNEIYEMLLEIDHAMRSYFNGVILVMIILSLIASLLFKIVGIDLSLLWGIVIGITNIIPYIGPYIGGMIVVLFALTSSFKKALFVLVIVICLQLIESNLISPNIHSKSVKTSPIMVLLFVSIFGDLLGIFGMIIAIPILSIFQILLNKIYFKIK